MKRALFFLLLLISFEGFGQVKQKPLSYGVEYSRVQADSAFRIPTVTVGIKNAYAGLDTAQLYYNKTDSGVYVYTGSQWQIIGGGSDKIDTVQTYTGLRDYTGSAKTLILTDSLRSGTFYYTGESENGATVIDGWRRVFDGKHYKPEWFEIGGKDMNGASYNRLTGTGIGSWGKAIAQICRLAGPDAIIDYKPGFQYPIDRLIPIKQNQVHSGGYLKRAAPVWTLLSNNEAIGSTTIEVADASSLQAGMLFLIKGAGTDGSHGDNSNGTTGVEWHEILSISGNTLTISGSVYRIEKAMLAGDTLITVAPLLYRENSILGASDSDYIVICRDMTFDGNYPQNNKIIDYQQPPTIGMYDGYVIANNCTFMNIPGENIYTAGGSITDCFADSIQGSFGHGTANLSTLDSIYHEFVVTNLKARDVGWGQAELQGHSEGRLWTNSTKTKNARFINCTMINSSRGTGRGKSIWNGNQDDGIIQVIGGYYKNSTGIMDLSGGDSLTAKGRMVIIQNAKFDNCGYLQITGNDVKRGNGLKSVSLLNNDFTNTRSYFDQIAVLDIIGNKFHSDSANNVINDSRASGTGTTTWFFGTGQWTMLFLTANMDRVNIDGNYFEGYRNDSLLNGVQLTLNDSTYRKEGTQMTDYYYCRSLNFSNNTIENFRYLTALSQTSFAKQTDWRMDNNKGYILWHPDYVSDYTYGLLIPPGANGNNNWFITPYMNNYSFPYIVYGVKSTGNYQKLRGGTLTNSKAEGGNYPFNVDPFNASPYHCVLKNNTGYSGTIRWGTDANTYKLGDSGNDIFTNATLTNYTAPKRFGIGENKTNY